MESFTSYFAEMPTAHRSLVLIGGLTIFFLIENAVPLFKENYNKTKHSGLNIFFTLTTVIVNFSMAALLVWTSIYVTENGIGILNWIGGGFWVALIVGLLAMDFLGAWLAHWVEHHVKWMWQFHVIHHTDMNVDTTSGNRHHPGESVIRFAFTIVAVAIVGAPMWLIFLYQSLSLIFTQFNHANIVLPRSVDKVLNLFFCTPNMHHVHHHYRQPYSDTNYGNIFSFWDRIAGTYIEVDNSKLVYGVDTYFDQEETNSVMNLLKIPFSGYKEPVEYDKEEVL